MQDSPSRVKLQIDPSGHCEVVAPSTDETKLSARPTLTEITAQAALTSPVPAQTTVTSPLARYAMSPPDNFETPPPEALRLNKLEDFQLKQKIIEEQNRS